MITNKFYEYLEDVIKEELKENYPDLSEDELMLAVGKAAEQVFEDESVKSEIRYSVHNAINNVYYDVIEPKRHTQFNTPNDGDVLVDDGRGNKIQLLCNNPENGKWSIDYKGYIFPAYWVEHVDNENWNFEVSEKLHEMLRELPRNEEIKFPYVQMWNHLDEWEIEGYGVKLLGKLEKILEGNLEDYQDEDEAQRDYEICIDAYQSGEHPSKLRRKWPSWIKNIIYFEFDDEYPKDQLQGVFRLTLNNGEDLKVHVGAVKRIADPRIVKETRWHINSWTAVDKGFPLFSDYDNELLEEFLTKQVGIK